MGTKKAEAEAAREQADPREELARGQARSSEHIEEQAEPRRESSQEQARAQAPSPEQIQPRDDSARAADAGERAPEHLHDYPHERGHSHEHAIEHRHDRPHPHYISLKLHDLNQLFNSMDPSPFIEKDLDDDAEEFIVSWAQEYPEHTPIRLRIHLEQWPSEDPKELVKAAVHNHFAHRAQITDLEFKRLLKQGRTSLLIGLLFLSACLASSQVLLGGDTGTWAEILRESLTIAGWVAMWRPMQIYLYDWWPVRRRWRVFRKLSHMPVEVTGAQAARG
jgi:hypothetical protein